MLNRLQLPSQFDRIIVVGGTVAAVAVAPIVVTLLVLLVTDEITAPEVVFWLAAVVIIGGALGTVLLPNIVHAAVSLLVTLLGVAGLYLLLASEFLALVQVLIYGGGVTILLLFALMLTRAAEDPIVTDGSQKPFAFIVAALIGGTFGAALLDADWHDDGVTVVGFRDLGDRLFRDFGVPFEIASLVLLVALIGAVAVARRDPDDDEQDEANEEAAP